MSEDLAKYDVHVVDPPPIVTWTTPYQEADEAWKRAGEELETGLRLRARLLLELHLHHVRNLIKFLDHEAAMPEGPSGKWTYDQVVNWLRVRGAFPPP